MSKTIKKCFYEKLTFIKMVEAHYRAAAGKYKKEEVLKFEMDLETNISTLIYKIKNHKYHMGRYREFYVYEPKKRLIKSLPYIDRVVHQWYVEEFIKPYFIPRFIKDTYACIDNRGAHKAVDVMQNYMRLMKREYGEYYILKCDIRKYFYSINKDILFAILKKKISDKDLLQFTRVLIYDKEDEKIGIPIGNYTSQYFANIYLSELDYFVKHKLRIKYYVRYMDDFILLLKTKEEAKKCKNIIEKFLKEHLELELNEKSKYYKNKMGANFCGYRIFETHRLLRNKSKKKIKKLIKKWNKFYHEDVLNYESVKLRWNSWRGHSKHANTYNLRCKYLDKIDFKDYLSVD